HIYLGSPQRPIVVTNIATLSPSCSFQNFCKKLTHFLDDFLPQANIPILGGCNWLVIHKTDKLQEFQYLRVNYESHVDWKIVTNYLQCNPDFHGRERYDCALVCTIDHHNNKLIIVQFQFMFEYIDLRFICLCACPAASLQIIPLQSIIRGVLLMPDFTHDDDYFLVNYIDGDMFLHSQTLMS
ncbi:hypothetical protein SCLCIDRAFT_136378, partial [Scleroderma citrinum Foug A]